MALDYLGKEGVATSMGHSPVAALIDPVAGSRTDCRSIKYCLGTYQKWYGRIITFRLTGCGLVKNEGEDALVCAAVESCSNFAIELNQPYGKDSSR
jgi:phosphoribosylformylglycinamidine synthase